MVKKNNIAKEMQGASRFKLWLPIAGAFAVALLAVGLVVALHLPSVQKEVIDHLVRGIESAAPVKIELGGYRWRPFSRLRLLNLNVRSSGKDVLQCEEAQIAYHFSAVWPYLIPDEIYLEKPVIHLEKDEKGKWQLPEASEAKGEKDEKPPVDPSVLLGFPWPRIKIISGIVSAQQNGRPILTIKDVTGDLALQAVPGPGGPKIKIDLGQWQGLFDEPPWGAWQLSGEAEIDGQSVSVASLNLALGEKSRIACRGTLLLLPPYDVDLKVDLAPFAFASFPEFHEKLPRLEEVAGALHLTKQAGGWSMEHELRSGLGNFNGIAKTELTPGGESSFYWSTHFAGLQVPGLPNMPEPLLSGQAELTIEGDLPESLRARLKGRLEPSKWGEQTIRKGDISGSYEKGSLTVNATDFQSSWGDFSAALVADLEGFWSPRHEGGLKMDLHLERANIEKVLPGVQQRMDGKIHLEGAYGASQIRNWKKWLAKADADINITGLTSFKAAGAYKDESLDVSYDLEAGDLQKVSAFFPPWQGKGRLTSKGSFKGHWPDFIWEGTVNSPRLEYGSVLGEQVAFKGKGKITGKEARREGSLKIQSLAVDGKGLGSFDLEVEQQEDDCRFQLKGEQPWNHLSAGLSGRLEKIWAAPRMLTLNQSRFTWKDQSGVVDGRLELSADRIKFHSFNVQEGRQKAHLTGELLWDAKSDLRLSLEEISLGQWLRTLGLRDGVTGVAGGQAHITGTAEKPEATIDMQVSNAAFSINTKADQPSPGSSVKTKSREPKTGTQVPKGTSGQAKPRNQASKAKIHKQATSQAQSGVKSKTSGIPDPVQTQPASAQESVAGTQEADACSQEPGAKSQGALSCVREAFERFQLQGTYASEVLQVQGELKSEIAESPIGISARLPVRFSFRPFRADVRQGDELTSAIKITGFRVERLLPYIDVLDKVGGRMDMDVQIGGPLGQPVVKVNGMWRDGNFQVKKWPHPIESITTEWQADSKQIFIRKAQMQHLGGRVDLTGRVEYPRFRVMEYEATGHDLEVPEFWGIKGRGDCEAKLTQTAESALLKADIHLSKAEMNLREFETDLARTIQIVGGETKGDLLMVGSDENGHSSYYSRLKMDLDVHLPSAGTWVRGKGLETEITGALRLQKALGAPLKLYGGLQALRGAYTFQGNKLTIVDGELAFFGSPQPDPILKILCRKEFKDVTVNANVNGPLSQPKFTLSSVPSMNQVDVLSYLLFGHPAGDLNSKQTFQLQNGAASWLGSETSRVLKGIFGDSILTPDTLQYHNTGSTGSIASTGSTGTTSTKAEGAVIEIGKYVTPDLYVTYEKGVQGEKEHQVQVEYRWNRHLSIQTQIGGADQSGVDVFWRHDFGK